VSGPAGAAGPVHVELNPQSDDQGHFVGFSDQGIYAVGVSGVVAAPGPVTAIAVNGRPARLMRPRPWSSPLGAPSGMSVVRFGSSIPRSPLEQATVTVTYGAGQTQALTFRRDTAATLARLRELAAASPNDPTPRCILGFALDRADKRPEAEAQFRAALKLDSRSLLAHLGLGGVLLAQSKPEASAAELREALKIDPDYASAHIALAVALMTVGQNKAAVAEARQAVKAEREGPTTLFFAAIVLLKSDEPEEGIGLLRRAVAIEPQWAPTRALLADALLPRKGGAEEAVTQAREAIALSPRLTEAHCTLATALEQQGKAADAIAECRKAIAINPNYAPAHARLGHLLCCEGKRREGIAECRKAIALNPNSAVAHGTLAAALYLEGDYLAADGARATAPKLDIGLREEVVDDIRGKAAALRCWNMDPRLPMGAVLIPILGLILGAMIGAGHVTMTASFTQSLAWRQLTGGALGLAVGAAVWQSTQWGFLIRRIGPDAFDWWLGVLWFALAGAALGLGAILASLAGRPFPVSRYGLGTVPRTCRQCRRTGSLWDLYADNGSQVCSNCLPLVTPGPPGS
jgi:tetratricopeptide (TPR) repeat protein